jgi:predicted nucleic acid-binding protein
LIQYLDTSVLVAVFTGERDSDRLVDWLMNLDGEEIAISQWTNVEFSSALSIKVRTGQITPELQGETQKLFRSAAENSYRELDIAIEDFATAARWCASHHTGVRAGDALHLAIAERHEARLCTLDRSLAAAAGSLGLKTLLL